MNIKKDEDFIDTAAFAWCGKLKKTNRQNAENENTKHLNTTIIIEGKIGVVGWTAFGCTVVLAVMSVLIGLTMILR